MAKKTEKQRRAEFLNEEGVTLQEFIANGHEPAVDSCPECKLAIETALKAAIRFGRRSVAREAAERHPLS